MFQLANVSRPYPDVRADAVCTFMCFIREPLELWHCTPLHRIQSVSFFVLFHIVLLQPLMDLGDELVHVS